VRPRGLPVLALVLSLFLGGAARASSPGKEARDQLRALRNEQSRTPGLPDPVISRRLVDVARALQNADAGSEAEVLELLSEAVARDSQNGVALGLLTLAYLKHGDLEFAEFYLNLARQSAALPHADPAVYEALGDVYRAQNRLEEAIEAWEQARRLGLDSPGLRRRIDVSRTEWAFAHSQRHFGSEHFEIYSDQSISEDTIRSIADSLETSGAMESDFFMAPPLIGQVVILYGSRRFFQFLETPDWVGGYYDGKIRVPLEAGHETSEATLGILRHELAHSYLSRISKARAPFWLQEGVAQWIEGRRITNRDIKPREGLPCDPCVDSLETEFLQRWDRERARRAYMTALHFLQFLADRRGIGSVVCFATDLGNDEALDDAARRELGASIAELEDEWKKSLR